MKNLSAIILILLTISCRHKPEAIQTTNNSTVLVKKDTSHAELYKVLQFVIADQQLNRRTGINTEPIPISEQYLLERLIDTTDVSSAVVLKDGKLVLKDTFTYTIHPPRVLTNDDISFMKSQLAKLKNFYWDNTRLGFNASNEKEWYQFSVPLFSRDSTKIVMHMYWTCNQFMCRDETPILVKKEQGHWIVETGPILYH